ncbi:hypothetical protein EV424DRAFT_1334281 [Suillus variegatus]|nr:hypothetical protein EV424DRAFT_1334281 [Suillus variegatus]
MGRHISKERKQIALQMSVLGIQDPIIRRYTGISERSLRYIQKTFRETGKVMRTPVCAGRPRVLDSLDANVSYWYKHSEYIA